MLRDRLKDIGLKITELADYLQVSRPTLYKFIDCYDNKEFDDINKNILKLFNYINEHELAGKKNVVNYILNNLVQVKESGTSDENKVIRKVKKLIIDNPDSNKSKLIQILSEKDCFDDIVAYLVEVAPLVKRKKLTEGQEKLLVPLNNFKNEIKEEK